MWATTMAAAPTAPLCPHTDTISLSPLNPLARPVRQTAIFPGPSDLTGPWKKLRLSSSGAGLRLIKPLSRGNHQKHSHVVDKGGAVEGSIKQATASLNKNSHSGQGFIMLQVSWAAGRPIYPCRPVGTGQAAKPAGRNSLIRCTWQIRRWPPFTIHLQPILKLSRQTQTDIQLHTRCVGAQYRHYGRHLSDSLESLNALPHPPTPMPTPLPGCFSHMCSHVTSTHVCAYIEPVYFLVAPACYNPPSDQVCLPPKVSFDVPSPLGPSHLPFPPTTRPRPQSSRVCTRPAHVPGGRPTAHLQCLLYTCRGNTACCMHA